MDKQLPNWAVPTYREALKPVLHMAARGDAAGWKLWLISDALLRGPVQRSKQVSKLQQRLSLFQEGRFSELAELALASRAPNPPDHPSSSLDWRDRAAHRAEYILKTKRSAGTAAKALRTPAPTQTASPFETLSVLRKLCPRAGIDHRPSSHLPRPPLSPPSDPRQYFGPPVIFSPAEVYDAVHRADLGSASGPNAQSFYSLRLLAHENDDLRADLSACINMVASGSVPQQIRDLLICGRTVAVPKGNGGVRPIVVGTTLALTGSMAMRC